MYDSDQNRIPCKSDRACRRHRFPCLRDAPTLLRSRRPIGPPFSLFCPVTLSRSCTQFHTAPHASRKPPVTGPSPLPSAFSVSLRVAIFYPPTPPYATLRNPN